MHLFSDPSFWTAAAAVGFSILFGGRILKQINTFLTDRRNKIIDDLRNLEIVHKTALGELEDAQKDLTKAKQLTRQWQEDAKKHIHEIERTSHVLMQYRRELARQNLELHMQDMRIRLLQELSHEFLTMVSQKLQLNWEIEGAPSFLEDLQKATH